MDALLRKQNIKGKVQNTGNLIKDAKLSVIPVRSVLVFLLATLVIAILLDFLPTKCNYWNWQNENAASSGHDSSRTYAIYGESKNEEYLIHVINVLELLGFQRVSLDDKWNLLWAHDNPFVKMSQRMEGLEKYQMVNNFPGCSSITNKVDLLATPLPFLPRIFHLPSQSASFLDYVQKNPNALVVEMHNEHRRISIQSAAKINLSNNVFVQEFISNTFLVDGYKFDIGVYVVVTSFDPLRLYIYSADVLFRFCTVKYHPFNSSYVDKYVVRDDYLPIWKVPSLHKYSQLGSSMRGAFDAYVRDKKLSPHKIWQQAEDIIVQTFLAKEQNIVRILRSYKTKNFFDLMRFDFVVDDSLTVHLMQANMSPNLSLAHFQQDSLLYERILYSLMNLVDIGSPVKINYLQERSENITEIITSKNYLATNINDCFKYSCHKFCNRGECDLCLPCLSRSDYEILEKAHYEHLHKINMKRIFPKPIFQPENFDILTEVQNMSKRNAWMIRWFHYKCLYDSTWCN